MRKRCGPTVNKESMFLRKLDKKGVTCITKHYGDDYYQDNQYMMIEYIDYSIERYLEA